MVLYSVVMADFGQYFDRLWPIVGLTDFGQTDFGQHFCFSVLAKFSTQKAETPKTQLDPNPPTPKPLTHGVGTRPFGTPLPSVIPHSESVCQ